MHDALVFAYDAQKIRRMIWSRKLNKVGILTAF